MATKRENCASRLFGAWACEPRWLSRALAAVKAGTWAPSPAQSPAAEDPGYSIGGPTNDVAIIPVSDAITKGETSFGGTSSVAVRRALRAATDAPGIRSVMLVVSSPGGTVSGTGDLADDVAKVNTSKPVYGFAEDLAASAAYWILSQCTRVFASKNASLGSIGTYAVLEDTTGMQEAMGVKLQVVSSSPLKGLGADGKVTDALVSEVQREIDSINALFLAAVGRGRKLSSSQLAAVATGQCWIAAEAKQLGLCDAICTIDEALAMISGGKIPATAAPTSIPSRTPAPYQETDEAKAERKALYQALDLDEAGLFAMYKSGNEQQKSAAACVAANRAGCGSDQIIKAWDTALAVYSVPEEKDPAMSDNSVESIKARAKADWASNKDGCQQEFSSERAYVGWRSAVALGHVKVRERPQKAQSPTSSPTPAPVTHRPAVAETPVQSPGEERLTREEAAAQAKKDWDANVGNCHKTFQSEKVYCAYRKVQLQGRAR